MKTGPPRTGGGASEFCMKVYLIAIPSCSKLIFAEDLDDAHKQAKRLLGAEPFLVSGSKRIEDPVKKEYDPEKANSGDTIWTENTIP